MKLYTSEEIKQMDNIKLLDTFILLRDRDLDGQDVEFSDLDLMCREIIKRMENKSK